MAVLSGPYLARAIADTATTPYSNGRETAHPPSTKLKPVCEKVVHRVRGDGWGRHIPNGSAIFAYVV